MDERERGRKFPAQFRIYWLYISSHAKARMVRTTLARINLIKENLRRRYLLWRSGYSDWDMYLRMTDPDIFWPATRVKDFYHGYTYFYRFDRGHKAYNVIYDYGPGGHRYGLDDIQDWCKEYIKGKYRFDSHRVLQNYWGEWEVNEIGGGDYIFIALKEEKDYTLFAMRWA